MTARLSCFSCCISLCICLWTSSLPVKINKEINKYKNSSEYRISCKKILNFSEEGHHPSQIHPLGQGYSVPIPYPGHLTAQTTSLLPRSWIHHRQQILDSIVKCMCAWVYRYVHLPFRFKCAKLRANITSTWRKSFHWLHRSMSHILCKHKSVNS